MFDKLKQFLTGEHTEDHVYTENTPIATILEDLQGRCSEGKELTEVEVFNEQGQRIGHWKKGNNVNQR